MIISYQLKVFSNQSLVSFGEFEHKRLIFLVKLEFLWKTVATTNISDQNEIV